MSMAFRRSAFEPWVRDFVDWSHGESGISRPSTEAEVAAHRGLFALDRVEIGNLSSFLRHAVGPDALEPATSGDLGLLLVDLAPAEADVDLWLARFQARRPLRTGNGRCGRALWMWHRLRSGWTFEAPLAGRLGAMSAERVPADPRDEPLSFRPTSAIPGDEAPVASAGRSTSQSV